MLTKEQNEQLTRVENGAIMGEVMRRYWIPALLASEIPHPDCPPVRVKLLGEKLIAFRDSDGRIGLIGEHCAHRRTSLFYGINKDCGLTCIYHGWKYNVNGKVIDTPAEPPTVDFKDKVKHTAYPCKEVAGVVFTYMGPIEHMPLFTNYEWSQLPLEHTYVTKSLLECNYLQGLEGECDSAHVSFLHRTYHAAGSKKLFTQDSIPQYETEETDFGVRLVALRQAELGQTYVRISSFVMPMFCCVPNGALSKEIDGYESHFFVPIDDTHTWRYDLGFKRSRVVHDGDIHRKKQIDDSFQKIRNSQNDYLQDRQMQLHVNYSGIEDFLNQDAAATESMGEICDRTLEYLGTSDKGVIALRRYLLNVLKEFQVGKKPPHLVYASEGNRYDHANAIAELLPPGEHWRHYLSGVLDKPI